MSTSKKILELYLLKNKLKGEKILAFCVLSITNLKSSRLTIYN